jgi:hypothetical protein
MIRLLLVCVTLLFGVGTAYATSDSFTVRTLVGSDTTSPSIPTLISATPVSLSQIDLVWTASSDDFLLSGYKVFRNSTQIATTTLTSYSDSGLVSGSLYSYFVQAYDSGMNVSMSSNVVATTTLVIATSTPSETLGTQSGSKSSAPSLDWITIEPQQDTVVFSWEVNSVAKFQLRWGRTSTYESGFVSNNLYKKLHTTEITDLEAGTVYEYELVGYTKNGKLVVLKRGTFKTLPSPDYTAPANVSDLSAQIRGGGDVVLTWNNPADADFKDVRIIRNHFFYPVSITDGFLVHEGGQESVKDFSPFAKAKAQYYSVFSRDINGNVSSGAVIAVSSTGVFSVKEKHTAQQATTSIVFSDFDIIQKEELLLEKKMFSDSAFLVRVPYDKLPQHLKTITFTLVLPEDGGQERTYLLKVDKERRFYTAVIPAVGREGAMIARFDIFDFETKLMTSVTRELFFYTPETEHISFFGLPLTTTRALDSVPLSLAFVLSMFSALMFLFYILKRLFVR